MSSSKQGHKFEWVGRFARPQHLGRWIAAALALALLAACQNGGLTYDPSTGLFTMPFGAQSHKSGG